MSGLAGHDAGYVHAVWLVASGLGVVVIGALAALYRRARKRAELEEIEALIAED